MPTRLKRYYGAKHLHFITCSCYHRLPRLGSESARDLFLQVLEEARQRYQFVIVGYVVMPEHLHLLMSEPEVGDPSVVMKVVKQRFARRLKSLSGQDGREGGDVQAVWQKRFYDFNVWSEAKEREKLGYMHANPVKRGLVSEPEQWRWSSFRSYACGEVGRVRINFQEWLCAIREQARQSFGES